MKHSKKLLSLLLVLCMVLSLTCTAFAVEEEPVTATKVDTIVSGDQVVIYYATDSKVMTTTSYTYTSKNGKTKDELVAAAATVADNKMTVPEGAAVFTVSVNEAGQYTFATADGKYLYADGTHVRLVNTQGENTLFVLEETEGGVFIKCANATFSGKAQYLEFYSGYFTVFGMDSSKENIYGG